MEATFDGPIDDFIGDLLTTNLEIVCRIFAHCEGFPCAALENPGLVGDFLFRKHIPHNTYFSGVPGRSISEIRSEADLRDRLSEHLKAKYGNPVPTPGTTGYLFPELDPINQTVRPAARFRDLQRELRNVVRCDSQLNLTEERPRFPTSVTCGRLITRSVATFVALIFLVLAWGLTSFFGAGPAVLAATASEFIDAAPQKLFWAWAFLIVTWYGIRRGQTHLAPDTWPRFDRGWYYLHSEFVQLLLAAWKAAILIVGAGLAFHYIEHPNAIADLGWFREIVFWVFTALAIFTVRFGLRRLRAPILRRLEIGPYVTTKAALERAHDRERVDALNMVGLIGLIVLYIPLVAFADAVCDFGAGGTPAARGFAALGWIAAATVLIAFAAALALCAKNSLLLIAEILQHKENKTYARAAELARRNICSSKAKEREEHHLHRNQNHFASVTLVKSWQRMLLLRLTLWLVNFVARYIDNKGKLGGIPTIFSARWLLLDGGHRLVFLTNYVGAWDSYLGEFSDLNAYIGVNAIWTNTYLPLTDAEKCALETESDRVGFPRSRLMLFGGAAYEQPFKAYVRKSQLPTLAWYGAYTDLSVPNINDNSRIRRDLFRTLNTAELNDLFSRI
ncbi:MAG: hypothetical protein AAGD13_18635 [Pseudomonadota bacterium]